MLFAVKLYRVVKPVPSGLTLNTVQRLGRAGQNQLARGIEPLVPPTKLYKFLKLVPSVLMANTVP